ncbi:hypothetical protein CI102_14320 [Trichoderma harzianum]|nr:hypothetical protein CI102_14320 [Trichoderma harzianum]
MLLQSFECPSAHVSIYTVSTMKRNTQVNTAASPASVYISNAAESATSPSFIRRQSTSIGQPECPKLTERLQSRHCPAPPASQMPPSPPSPLTCKQDGSPQYKPTIPHKDPRHFCQRSNALRAGPRWKKGQLNPPVFGLPRIQGVKPCHAHARMEQRQNLLLEDTNVPRMWPPLLCIASWITACMNTTYMHSCEAPCQHGTVSMGSLGRGAVRGCIDTCAPAVDASQLPEQRNTKEREMPIERVG